MNFIAIVRLKIRVRIIDIVFCDFFLIDRRGLVTEEMAAELAKSNDPANARSQYGTVRTQPVVSRNFNSVKSWHREIFLGCSE